MSNCPLALFVPVALLLTAPAAALAGKADGRLDIQWIDSEGGGSTLIVTPAGESILIDTGNPGERDSGRIAKAAKEAGLTKIDHLIITHYHIDHMGGVVDLAKLIPIGTLYDNGNYEARKQEMGTAYEGYVAFNDAQRVVIQPGDKIELLTVRTNADKKTPPLTLTCLATRQETIKPGKPADLGPDVKADAMKTGSLLSTRFTENKHELALKPVRRAEDKSDNANSVVMLLSYGDFDYFNGGDVTWNIEEKLVAPINLVGTVDVYQVNHHGLDVSNNPLLIQSIAPTVAVFNNGDAKGCMPPVFQAIKATPSIKAIYQVHKNLRSTPHNTGDEMIANLTPQRECEGHTVMLSVAADGKSYAIRVPSRKHEKVFESK
jgi:beta-lactamase superfamily II metal-dependent hydrolase